MTDAVKMALEALRMSKDLLDVVEQTPGNVWHVAADDPETACCDTMSAVEKALAALEQAWEPVGLREIEGLGRAVKLARETMEGHPDGKEMPDLALAWLANRAEIHAAWVIKLANQTPETAGVRKSLEVAIGDLQATYEAAKSGKPIEISIGQWGRLSHMKATAALATPSQPDPQYRGQAFDGEGEELAEAVRCIMARCEALEDEASNGIATTTANGRDEAHEAGFWRGQKSTAKSIREHLHDMTRAGLSEAREAGAKD